MRDAKKLAAKNKSLNKEVRDIQAGFKETVLPLYTENIVNNTSKQRLTSIATNFFVYQSVNEHNIGRLISTLSSCSYTFDQCLISNVEYPDQFPELFDRFILSIPVSARDFSSHFYDSTLPTILDNFNVALDELSEISEIEEDNDVPDNTETPIENSEQKELVEIIEEQPKA